MVKTPRRHRLRLVGLLALGVSMLAMSACGGDDRAVAPPEVDAGAPAVGREYAAADLRPEAVTLVELTDPRDAALVALWSNYFVQEASVVSHRDVWADDVADEVATCLSTNGFDPPPGSTLAEGARALIASQVMTTPSYEEEAPLPEAPAWVRAWESDPEAEACTAAIDARAGYLESGPYGERRQAAVTAGTWINDDQAHEQLRGLLQEHCPDAIANDEGVCARLGEFLAEGAPGMKREITANWSVLEG